MAKRKKKARGKRKHKTVHVKGYYHKDGTYVRPHRRPWPKS